MAELSMYTDGPNCVIAETPEQATGFYLDHIGMEPEDFGDDEPLPAWEAMSPDAVLGFYVDEDGEICDESEGQPVEKTVAEWIAEFGARYMGSEQ